MDSLKGQYDNPNNIERADTVVGIPSYNEADSIGFVVSQIAKGLTQCSTAGDAVIVNVDNNSPDGTREAFFAADAEDDVARIYISTPEGVTGKGTNIRNLFEEARRLTARRVFMIDADLKSIEPAWIYSLFSAIEDGNDLIVPLYQRNEYDGTITNHIAYPLLRGVLNIDVRQPIGGEFAFSSRMVDYILDRPWAETTYQYGIDIFLTLHALLGGFHVGQVHLGSKIHKPSAPKLGPMFRQVLGTLFGSLHEHRNQWLDEHPTIRPLTTYGSTNPALEAQHMAIDYKALREQAVEEFTMNNDALRDLLPKDMFHAIHAMMDEKIPAIDSELWTELLYHVFYVYGEADEGQRSALADTIAPLWLGRATSFIRETIDLDHAASEERIVQQAEHFAEQRDLLLQHYTNASG